MAKKRAQWVEGITQSRRILRDLAEIATSAIKDESGIIEAENWSLIYPRPFEESNVVRGIMVKDETDLTGRRYIPTGTGSETMVLVGTAPIELDAEHIIPESITIKSINGQEEYVQDVDFLYNDATNAVSRTVDSAIVSGSELVVSYSFTFNQILDTVPVVIERKLEIAEENREVPASQYVIDYAGKSIEFIVEPPAAEYYQLTFSEKTSTYGRTQRTEIRLEEDPLSANGRKFKLPSMYGEIAKATDITQIAAGNGLTGSGEVSYTISLVDKTVTFAQAPTLSVGAALYFTFYQAASGGIGVEQIQRATLIESEGDETGTIFKIQGTINSIIDSYPHFVEVYTQNTEPVLEMHLNQEDSAYQVVSENNFVVDYENSAANFISIPEVTDEFVMTFKSRGAVNLELGLSKITNRVVLKTITQPESLDQIQSGDSYGAIDTNTSLEMYVEIEKPTLLVNPETGLERYTDINGSQVTTQENNHYINIRMFDKWDDATQSFATPKYDKQGVLISDGASVSNWSKYSWFRDWKEYLVDELDSDPGTSNLADGLLFQEIKTNGLTPDFPIQFWMSVNNNRIALVLMGDPTLDQDNFLTSFAYIGRIHPFYETKLKVKRNEQNEIDLDTNGEPIIEEVHEYFNNDVKGNFAMTVGSSTVPADIGIPPKGQAMINLVDLARNEDNTLQNGLLWDMVQYAYAVTYLTEGGESRPTTLGVTSQLYIPAKTVQPEAVVATPTQGVSIRLRFTLPDEATGYKIYRFHHQANSINGSGMADNMLRHQHYKLVTTVTRLESINRTIDFIDDGTNLTMTDDSVEPAIIRNNSLATDAFYKRFASAVATARSFESVVRDKYTGSVLEVKYSERYGKNTGTGVSDVMMYATRSGLKYQSHFPAFVSTEEFIRKEESGQSRYTGKFHLCPIYIEHTYDKQRGWLDGVMAVEDSGIEHLNEMTIHKDTAREEIYKFFRINAPYSLFNNSPNHSYGIAMIKSSMGWSN